MKKNEKRLKQSYVYVEPLDHSKVLHKVQPTWISINMYVCIETKS